jgi:hypothetical protein
MILNQLILDVINERTFICEIQEEIEEKYLGGDNVPTTSGVKWKDSDPRDRKLRILYKWMEWAAGTVASIGQGLNALSKTDNPMRDNEDKLIGGYVEVMAVVVKTREAAEEKLEGIPYDYPVMSAQ